MAGNNVPFIACLTIDALLERTKAIVYKPEKA